MPLSGDGNEALSALDPRCITAIAGALQQSWPGSATLNPANLGLDASLDRHHAFLSAIQGLCDRGLLAYEALLIGIGGPEVRDATLTARGRALLQNKRFRAAA
ncbi:hypothetical protein [Sphingomonas azotifigens]|uniref:hypothetical protein n=1 Tax=Sphingomonas azotifigens TaxID=330920 RepID=UPI001FE9F6DE|nr:hypothetical protein [Sphingomonas azotifigens]